MKRIGLVVIAIAGLLLVAALTGCSTPTPPTAPALANNITEKLLLAYDAKDYASYLAVFDEDGTGSVGTDWFNQTAEFNVKKIGHYIPNSIVLKDVKVIKTYTEVTYIAKFTDIPGDVTVIVDLDITDRGTFAAGIWVTSPEMYKMNPTGVPSPLPTMPGS